MVKRYQIFISSTFADLKDERGKVMETILSLDCFPAGMELFPAMDEEQFEYIKRIIDDSDFYLLIIGGRYGTLYKDGKSYTEKEYDYAVSKNIPVIVFDHQDYTQLPAKKTDRDNNKEGQLKEFKKRVASNRIINYWSNADDLSAKVAKSLAKLLNANPDGGWIRASSVTNISSKEEVEKLNKELEELRAFKAKHENDSKLEQSLKNAQDRIIDLERQIEEQKTYDSDNGNDSQKKAIDKHQESLKFWNKSFTLKATLEFEYKNKKYKSLVKINYTLKEWFKQIGLVFMEMDKGSFYIEDFGELIGRRLLHERKNINQFKESAYTILRSINPSHSPRTYLKNPFDVLFNNNNININNLKPIYGSIYDLILIISGNSNYLLLDRDIDCNETLSITEDGEFYLQDYLKEIEELEKNREGIDFDDET